MMKNRSTLKTFLFISFPLLLVFLASCKKDNNNNNNNGTNPPATATPTKLGVYAVDSSIYKILLMNISGVGTQTVNYDLVYDTGSGGLVLDANGVLPASMITNTGFNFTGDSTVVDGITITNQTDIVEYGDDTNTTDKVYGNLAYADIKIGDVKGNITIKRLPFFLYYKAVDGKGKQFSPHEFDVFGVSQEYDVTFSNNAYITSPFDYYDPGKGLTKGFKMAAVPQSSYSYNGTFVPAITLGLTSDDLSPSSGFTMSQLNFYQGEGYVPVIPATLTYKGKSFQTSILFDTGTEPYNYIQDPTGPTTATLLDNGVSVSTTLNSGFNYSFTTSAADYLSYVENPSNSGSTVTVMSLEFFLNNEYMLDFVNHKLGLKKD
jgi:hypothetical protein